MAIWTPPQHIGVKTLGLPWRGDELLLSEVEDSLDRVKGMRPLGGGIEFGESREAALCREFEEELGCSITIASGWTAFENRYVHEGATGHEFLFLANIRLNNSVLYEREVIEYEEDNGLLCRARWVNPLQLDREVELYPLGLLDLIREGTIRPDA